MTYRIILQPSDEADVDQIVGYLNERSPQGAAAWCKAWDELLAELRQRAEGFGLCPSRPNTKKRFAKRSLKPVAAVPTARYL